MSITLKPGERLSVLIVDDEAEIREALRAFLKTMGCWNNIVEAENGHQAFFKTQKQNFDLIVADFKMPKWDGLHFIKNLRQTRDDKRKTPVLFISGNFTKESITLAMSREVKHFLAKPFNGETFVAKVEEVLRKEKREKIKTARKGGSD